MTRTGRSRQGLANLILLRELNPQQNLVNTSTDAVRRIIAGLVSFLSFGTRARDMSHPTSRGKGRRMVGLTERMECMVRSRKKAVILAMLTTNCELPRTPRPVLIYAAYGSHYDGNSRRVSIPQQEGEILPW